MPPCGILNCSANLGNTKAFMANLQSSKKDLRRIAKKTERNRAVKSSIKTYLKKARTSAKTGAEAPLTAAAAIAAISALDKAVQNGVVHKNHAARRKSRLMKALNKAAAQ